jgi:polyribonucleotide nucleotidyltransferase
MIIDRNSDQMNEERFYEALEFGQSKIQMIIAVQRELTAMVGTQKKEFQLNWYSPEVMDICSRFGERLNAAVFREDKLAPEHRAAGIKKLATKSVVAELGEDDTNFIHAKKAFEEL